MNFDSFIGALPQLGPSALLVCVVMILGKLWLGSEARHKEELERINAAHDNELLELRSDIAELRKDVDALRVAIELERSMRFEAETNAHALALELMKQQGRGTG